MIFILFYLGDLMELNFIRNELDKLDNELMSVLAKRMDLVLEVAAYKEKNNLPLCQQKRENEIFEAKRALARKYGLNEKLVEDLFKRIIKDSIRIQQEITRREN